MVVKKIITLLLVCLFFCKLNSQTNLVPNYSFEDTTGNCDAQMTLAAATQYVKKWYSSSNFGNPFFFNYCANSFTYPMISTVPNNCNGYQYPRTGNSYVGTGIYIIDNPFDSANVHVDYFSVKLFDKLKANHCYYGEFYVSLANCSDIAVNQIGMYLTPNTFTTTTGSFTNTIQPQVQWDTTQFFTDTLNWVKVSSTFIAQGGEEFLTIGNFRDGLHLKKTFITTNFVTGCTVPSNPHASYIYVDDVSLYELPQTPIGISNYTICLQSDSLLLGDTARVATTYQWFANGIPISNQSQITIKPNTTTTYVLQITACSSSTQSFVVTYNNICPPVITELIIPNTFTPNDDGINDVFKFDINGVGGDVNFVVYNRWGNLVASKSSASIEPNIYSQITILWDGRTTSGEPCTEGVYFYTLKYTDANDEQQTKNGYVSLFR